MHKPVNEYQRALVATLIIKGVVPRGAKVFMVDANDTSLLPLNDARVLRCGLHTMGNGTEHVVYKRHNTYYIYSIPR